MQGLLVSFSLLRRCSSNKLNLNALCRVSGRAYFLSNNLVGVVKCFEVVLVTTLSVVKLNVVRGFIFPGGGRSGLST
jgi:hypothetical protein